VAVPRSLPRGVHGLDRDVVLMSQRARLLEGIVEVVAEKGYPATRVQDVTRAARVSRTTFYEQFSDKEDCFLAAYAAGAQAHFEHVAAAGRRTRPWFDRLHACTVAYLEVLAAEPAYARTFLLEVQRAGQPALDLRVKTHRRYADLLKGWYGTAPDDGERPALPDEVFTGAVGAIDEVVASRLREHGAERLGDLAAPLLYIALALLGLVDEARRALAGA
jgi:AcrR family transcriptional regulator